MPIDCRQVRPDELGLLATIDRAERIDAQYAVVDGRLVVKPCTIDVPGWYPGKVATHVERLGDLQVRGGVVLGAWDGGTLVGLGSLDPAPVGGDPTVLQLDLLHVSRPARHRGIGRRLVGLLADRARSRGAASLYISATPTRNTVDAYLRMGAVVLTHPDPHLLAREPDDIHLLLDLGVFSCTGRGSSTR